MRGVATIIAGLALAAAVASPVQALYRGPHPTPAGIWIDLHFKTAAGKSRVVVLPVQLARADQAQSECSNPRGMAAWVKAAILNDPSIADLTFVGANCEANGKGVTKVAIGAWPAGKGPQFTEERGFSPKVQSDLVEGAAAIVVLNYVASNGRHVKTAIGYNDGKASFYMRTCPATLKRELPMLIRYAQATRVGEAAPTDPRRYDFATLEFVGAECAPPPRMLGDLAGPNTSLEVTPRLPLVN